MCQGKKCAAQITRLVSFHATCGVSVLFTALLVLTWKSSSVCDIPRASLLRFRLTFLHFEDVATCLCHLPGAHWAGHVEAPSWSCHCHEGSSPSTIHVGAWKCWQKCKNVKIRDADLISFWHFVAPHKAFATPSGPVPVPLFPKVEPLPLAPDRDSLRE